jgi:ATP-dependent protease ClpP protease subunit
MADTELACFPTPGAPKVFREENTVFILDDLDAVPLYYLKKHMRDIIKTMASIDHINIVIDSTGGSPCVIYDFLKAFPLPVHGYVEGYCCSGATTLLLGCTERYMAPSSLLLIHGYRGEAEDDSGKEGALKNEYISTVNMNNTLRRIYKKETKIPTKDLEAMMVGDEIYLSAEQCLKWKIIDGIQAFTGAD